MKWVLTFWISLGILAFSDARAAALTLSPDPTQTAMVASARSLDGPSQGAWLWSFFNPWSSKFATDAAAGTTDVENESFGFSGDEGPTGRRIEFPRDFWKVWLTAFARATELFGVRGEGINRHAGGSFPTPVCILLPIDKPTVASSWIHPREGPNDLAEIGTRLFRPPRNGQ